MKANHIIIGVSSKWGFGEWTHKVVKFRNNEDAQKWLHTEEYDFRERELFTSEWHAARLIGKGAKQRIAEAEYYNESQVYFPWEVA